MRELATEKGKQVELELSGGETEMDRTLVDLIYEPILHLLRNAVDHGIESADERETLGKPRIGRIKMRAYHEGNQVVVEVSDDGRGVDVNALRAKAVHAKHITSEEAENMTDDEAIELLFLSGVSTASEITRVSGRGIGGVTVKSVMEELRGSVSVKTEPGVSTTFVLRMPLTLAIIKALLFSASDQLFAVPLLVVNEVAHIDSSDIVFLDGFESFRLRDRFISIVRPGRVLGFDRSSDDGLYRPSSGKYFIVVVSAGERKFGIAAELLAGEQELVIKPLDSEWVQNDALAGASLLGDGRVVLIMDAGSLFRKALRYERLRGKSKELV